MKTTLLLIGKTDEDYLERGIQKYVARIVHYTPFDIKIIPDVRNTKNISELQQKQREAAAILAEIATTDFVVLLDENGTQFSSRQFAQFIEKTTLQGTRRLLFVVGGPYGFAPEIYQRANQKISLSPMTFSHQMVRLIFVEQLYRAHTILRGEPYHHD